MPQKLKYNLTTKMILETDIMLKHVGIDMKFIERPDLKHTDSSVIYLPYRVCEDCYLLFETMNEIKNSQIQIGNFFRIPVNDLNFGVEIYKKNNDIDLIEEEINKKCVEILLKNCGRNSITCFAKKFLQSSEEELTKKNINKIPCNYLYRFMFMINDIILNEEVIFPDEKLYIIFNLFGNWYKVKLEEYYPSLDYFNVNFSKIYYLICDEHYGFINYIDKNKSLQIKIGHFVEDPVKLKDQETAKIFKREIIIEDLDIFTNIHEFVEFCSTEIDCTAVRYADNNRNTMNGLLFKEDKPHYVGKLRCLIRVSKEKEIQLENINHTKHFNVKFYF
jgi:hypothetical protein